MAGGTTSGGRKGKLNGEVGAAGLMGCGIFATKSAASAITGQGKIIAKLGLTRCIVEDLTENETCPELTLRHYLDDMLKHFNAPGGGVALQANGCFGVYFTSPAMPYAVIKDEWITYGWKIDDIRCKKYCKADADIILRCMW